jgi:TonB-linked SusC/RagA family outer membrane protein
MNLMALDYNMRRYLLMTFFAMMLFNTLDAQISLNIVNDSVTTKGSDSKSTFLDQIIQVPFANRIQRKYITGSVSSVSGETLKKINTPFLSNTLFGQLSGLHVQQGGGSPGNTDFPSLFIRGRQTFQDNSVLVLVDGFESNWFTLLPEEIESVTVLKDAAALAQFGMDGANGVVMITTKRGVESNKTNINFSSRFGIHSARFLPKLVNNGDYAQLFNVGMLNDGRSIRDGYFRNDSIVKFFNNQEYPYLYPDVNWFDQVVRPNALSQDYTLSFTGGKQDVKYFLAMGYADYKGLYAGTDNDRSSNTNYNLKRYNLRANFDVNITSFLSAQANLRATMMNKYFPNTSENALWRSMSLFIPYAVRTEQGKWGGAQGYADNPSASVLQRGYQSINDRTVDANVKLIGNMDFITKGLKFFWQLNFSNFFFDTYNKTRPLYFDEVIPRPDLISTPGVIPYDVFTRGTVDNNFTITQGNGNQFNRTSLLGGAEYEKKWSTHSLYSSLIYFQEKFNGDGSDMPFAKQRLMGRVSYNFSKSYFADLNVAYSGSENFPKGNRFGIFPALSAGWVMSNEKFMSNQTFLSFLKLRTSAGLLGNDNTGNVGRFIYNQYYNGTGNFLIGNNLGVNAPMFNQSALANPNVTWEKAARYNIGFESVILKSLSLSADYFIENRSDIFINPNSYVPSLMGATFSSINRGETRTSGGEIEIIYNQKLGSLNFYAGGNISFSKNKIIDIAEPAPSDPYLAAKGNSINQPFVLEFLGFFKDQSDISSSPTQLFGSVVPGDIKYKDQNGDGVIDNRDRKPFGLTSLPQIFYGFNVGADCKGFDLNISIQGAAKRTVSLLDNNMIIPFLNGGVKPTSWLKDNYWTPTRGDNAKFPRLSTIQNDNNNRPSTLWQRNGAFVRIQNIEIGYTISEKITKKAGMHTVRFFICGNNLFTFDDINEIDVDPEVMNIFVHPPMKSFNFGFALKL